MKKIFEKIFGASAPVKKVGYCVTHEISEDDVVVVKTTVPHWREIYNNPKEIYVVKSPNGELDEKEAFEEYFALRAKYSSDKGFIIRNDDDEALKIFSQRKILSVKNSTAGVNPVHCGGSGIFTLEGGIFTEGFYGRGLSGIEKAFKKNNAAVGKTVAEVFGV